MITIRRQPAVQTQVPALGQRLSDFRSTGAGLRSPARIYFHEHAPGTLSLVREREQKARPSCVSDRLRQHSSSESLDIQILNGNQPVAIDQIARLFVMKV